MKKQNLSNAEYVNAQQIAETAASYQKSGDSKNAEKSIKQALQLDPQNANYMHFLGLLKYQQHDTDSAIRLISNAIDIIYNKPLFHYNLGVIYKSINQLEEALKRQEIAHSLDPTNLQYINEIALIHIEMGHISSASKYLNHAIELNRFDATTLSNYAYLLRKDNKPEESIRYAEEALSINPQLSAAYMNIGQALAQTNKISEGIDYIEKSFEFGNHHLLASQQSLLLYSLYASEKPASEIFKKHREFCHKYLPIPPPIEHTTHLTEKRQLSIGFISSDFRNHSVFHFLIALLKNYNKNNFIFSCYSGVLQEDAETTTIKDRVDRWVAIQNKNTAEITQQIKNDKVDILIDLSGHSKGNFLPVFAQKPAPLQITFLGYPFSTGLDNIDYKITDEYADPYGYTESIHTEQLLRLNPCFLCYTPFEDSDITNTLPIEQNNYVTFGSFNKFSKLSPTILKIWSQILSNNKNSKLVLKNNQPISGLLQKNILAEFSANNIDSDRITFIQPAPTYKAHISQYNDIDIALDPFPYNGTTTTFEALWMGVPVLTLCGNDHRSRVSYSILRSLTHEELIANTKEEYIGLATQYANDIAALKNYKSNLRQELKTSVLTNGEDYTKKFEQLMQDIWSKHVNAKKASSC